MRIWAVGLFCAALVAGAVPAQSCSNPICLENQLPGNLKSEWDLDGLGSVSIAGFTDNISVNHGSTINFKVKTSSNRWKIDIYRLGYYQGKGARLVKTINVSNAQNQPAPLQDSTTGLYDAGNWTVSASWAIPASAVSGVYTAKLTDLNNTANQNHIPFIVRADESGSAVVFKTADTTWQAYNGWFGNNLYGGNGPGGDSAPGRAYKVSYNRPFGTRDGIGTGAGPQDYIFTAEFSAIEWLERNGYDVSYIATPDLERSPSLLQNHKIFLSVGHDEYWSAGERSAVEAARDVGVHLAFWGGNDIYWKTRWEPSIDGTGTPYRTLVCYKETRNNAPLDPRDTSPTWTWTGTWRDPRFSPPADGGRPENALAGTIYHVDSWREDAIQVPYGMSSLRFWRNTPNVAVTPPGQVTTLTQNILGYEWNTSPDNGFAPPGLIHLSSTTLNILDVYLRNYGSITGDGTATHNLTLYKVPSSGSIVFGAGTVFWAWGLGSNVDGNPTPTDPNIQQSMVNLFADMGVQPGTLQSGLVPAAKSTDATPPASGISAPANGASFVTGQAILVSGFASDVGGKVAGVEVSVDGGATWRRASGTTSWTYVFTPAAPGSYSIKSRATDDSLNTQSPVAGPTIGVTSSGSSLFSTATITESSTADDPNSVELGVKVFSSAAGYINGIRFYKNLLNIGPHTGTLWNSTGTLLASAAFTGETPSGWQQVKFPSPVPITANTTYIASFHTPGFYSVASNYFTTPSSGGTLTAPSSGNGVYAYGSGVVFPSNTVWNAPNYWVDVVYGPPDANTPPVCNNASGFVTARNTALEILASTLVANCTDPLGRTLSLTGVSNPTNGTVTFNGANTVTFTPAAGYSGPASFRYTVSNGQSGTGTASATVSLTVYQEGVGFSLFTGSDVPAIVDVSDSPVELGVKFYSSTAGQVTGVQFYKSPQETGTHTAHLWSATGTLLASATFTNETASGWQSVTLASPVQVTAGTTYIVSYHSNGRYSATGNYFATARTIGSLTAPSSASSGGNGVYAYSASAAFPSNSYNATNYFVTPVFGPASANSPPICNNISGLVTAQNTALTIQASAILANCSDPNGYTLSLAGVSNPANGTVTYDGANTVTFTPTTGYTGPASFAYTVFNGHTPASATVSLTVSPAGTSYSLFSASDIPALLNVNDSPVELGVKFYAAQAGKITGIKFYKGSQEAGTHTGELWSSAGTLLASVTFANETASGWQSAAFASPVAITAGTTYIASYHSNGKYSVTGNYFSTAQTSGPLTAPSSASSGGNGVYAYGSSATFPSNSYNASNYWIDVIFMQ